MSDDNQSTQVQTVPQKYFEGGMATCVCCKVSCSANKTIFGVSPYFPFYPPDHFCKECAEALDVMPMEIE